MLLQTNQKVGLIILGSSFAAAAVLFLAAVAALQTDGNAPPVSGISLQELETEDSTPLESLLDVHTLYHSAQQLISLRETGSISNNNNHLPNGNLDVALGEQQIDGIALPSDDAFSLPAPKVVTGSTTTSNSLVLRLKKELEQQKRKAAKNTATTVSSKSDLSTFLPPGFSLSSSSSLPSSSSNNNNNIDEQESIPMPPLHFSDVNPPGFSQ